MLLTFLYPLVPESPRYLALNGRLEEARNVLESISLTNKKPLPKGELVGSLPKIQSNDGGRTLFESQISQLKRCSWSLTALNI